MPIEHWPSSTHPHLVAHRVNEGVGLGFRFSWRLATIAFAIMVLT